MKSPCIRMCTLNEDDVCLGCGRLLGEITSWVSLTAIQRQKVTDQCEKRITELDKHSPYLQETRRRFAKNT
ncbi:MAG: DUF1289 domain-containing protein [Cycloclasticus sp.]|nr:DUF1289 domain-containing protein [Cycloclasticus sp.]